MSLVSRLIAAATVLVLGVAPAGAADAPSVVVSIAPLHSLVSGVMQGIGSPVLLVKGGGSPHSYAMKPSDAQALGGADVVFWIGGGLETFLARPLATLASSTRVITVADADGVSLLEGRAGGAWTDDTGHRHAGTDHDHAGRHNLHLWLDPDNAAAIVGAVARALGEVDTENAARYAANAETLRRRLEALTLELDAILQPVKARPYIVFHDAYQYLETRFGLNAAGSVALNPERKPGARRIVELRQKIVDADIRCVFREPQFEPRLIRTIVEGTGAKVGTLDPLGADIPPGRDAYFTLMRNMAKALRACLDG